MERMWSHGESRFWQPQVNCRHTPRSVLSRRYSQRGLGSDGAAADSGYQHLDHQHMHGEDRSAAAYIAAAGTLILALTHFHAIWWLDAALIVSSADFRPVGRQHRASAGLVALDHSPASVWVSIGIDLLEQLL